MARTSSKSPKSSDSTAHLGFEATLWLTADQLPKIFEADFGNENADTFHKLLHPDLRADYVLANPPFNPPSSGTNLDWSRSAGFIHHLAPQGMAGFVLSNGSMSSNQSGEGWKLGARTHNIKLVQAEIT